MTNYQPYFGIYYFMGLVFEVKQIGDQLVTAVAGVPDGFEIVLIPVGGDNFKMRGGPVDGSTINFGRDGEGTVTAIRAGQFELARITPEALDGLPIVERLRAPEFDLTPEKREQFTALLQSGSEKADGGWIVYNLPYPIYEFVQYITAQDEVIFHGSNNLEIETFEPIRKSMELRDETGRGNIQGVYGTHDGLWAMFFAVVDRAQLKGSIHNGVMYFHNCVGDQLASYNFSINKEQLVEQPYTEGALYLLPRETFVRLKMTPESYTNEWASEEPVKPIAKLRVQPEDFPFLEQIGGHDDSELIRLGAISEEIRATATAATLDGDRFTVTLPEEAPVVKQLDEYISLQRVMLPAAEFDIRRGAEGVKLVVTSLPPAMQQMVAESYKDLLK